MKSKGLPVGVMPHLIKDDSGVYNLSTTSVLGLESRTSLSLDGANN